MGLFDRFKKKKEEPEYDVTNLSVHDLRLGFIFDYDMKSWEIKQEFKYDWGDNNFSREFVVDSGDDRMYLEVEDEGELLLTISKGVKVFKLDDSIPDKVKKKGRPPKKLKYNDNIYYLDEDAAGYCHDVTKGEDDWEEMIVWTYYTEDEKEVASITQWDEQEFEATVGRVIQEFEISNIIPGNN